MAKNVFVDHFGGTQTHAETWVELQQINHCDMEEVRCGVWISMSCIYSIFGCPGSFCLQLKTTAEPNLSPVYSEAAAYFVN